MCYLRVLMVSFLGKLLEVGAWSVVVGVEWFPEATGGRIVHRSGKKKKTSHGGTKTRRSCRSFGIVTSWGDSE